MLSLLLTALPIAQQLPTGWNDIGAELDRGWLEHPRWLEDGPPIEAKPRHSPATDAEIEALIDSLQATDSPDAGYSATVSGWRFLPLPELRGVDALILLDGHGLRASEPLTRLVELGPFALPQLLAHLEDARPTCLTFGPKDRMSCMWLQRDLPGNPLNEREVRAVGEWVFPRWQPMIGSRDASHTVSVGDLCFVALGQIVNRPGYRAVRYQPSGITRVSSPVRDPELAAMLRDAWEGEDPRALLLESLTIDFRSRGAGSADLQSGAAIRLAYYFPEEATAELVAWVDTLYGPNTESMLDALHQPIAEAVARARERSGARTPLARLLRLEGELPNPVLPWFLSRLEQLHGRDPFPRTDLDRLLRAAGSAGADLAAPVFSVALESEDPRWLTLALRLLSSRQEGEAWQLQGLKPLLNDERPTGEYYAVLPPFNDFGEEPSYEDVSLPGRIDDLPWDDPDRPPQPIFQHERHPLRVCDEAARALARLLPDAVYSFVGDHAEMDAQRAALREALARELARRR